MKWDEHCVESIDELFDKLGTLGWFQFAAFCGYMIINLCTIFTVIQMVYAGMTPDWHCVVSSSEQFLSNYSFGGNTETKNGINFSLNTSAPSTLVEVLSGNQTFRACSVNGRKCDAFKFIGSSRTAVSEWSLVCDMAWVKQIIISVQMAGTLIGASVSAQIGDYFGRQKVIYASLFMCSLVEFVAGFSVSWQMFTVCKHFAGMLVGIINTNALPYHIEISPKQWRPLLASFPASAIGICIFAGVAFVLDDWVFLHFTNAVIILPLLLGWFYFPESPRWLAVHDKLHEAEKAVETIARLNRKPVPAGTAALMAKIAKDEKEIRRSGKKYTVLDLFSTRQLAKLSIIFSYICSCINVVFYGITFEISNLQGDVCFNMFLTAVLQIPVQLTTTFIANRFGRRGAAVLYFLISNSGAAGCLVVSLVAQDMSIKGEIISGLCLVSRMSLATAYNVVILMSIELYPTAIRSLGYSFVSCSSLVGAILAPFLVNFDNMIVESHAIITLLILTCWISVLVVKETGEVPLPESSTVNAEELPRIDSYLLTGNGHKNSQSINSATE